MCRERGSELLIVLAQYHVRVLSRPLVLLKILLRRPLKIWIIQADQFVEFLPALDLTRFRVPAHRGLHEVVAPRSTTALGISVIAWIKQEVVISQIQGT